MPMEGIEDLYPLAPTQAGMVYHGLVDPDAGVYVGQVCFRLEGVIDRELMERTWDRLVQRHAALRVSILWGDLSQPLQAVHREVSVPWQHHDWRIFPGRSRMPPSRRGSQLTGVRLSI